MAQRDGEPENAAELEFGKDLNNCECLSTSEVAEFFSKYEPGPREKRCAAPGMPKPPARAGPRVGCHVCSDSLKTREYVNRVRQFKGMQDNYAARECAFHSLAPPRAPRLARQTVHHSPLAEL